MISEFFNNIDIYFLVFSLSSAAIVLFVLYRLALASLYLLHHVSLKWDEEELMHPSQLRDVRKICLESFSTQKVFCLNEDEIKTFMSFLEEGSLSEMMKCATSYEIKIEHEDLHSSYYLHHDAIGPKPGGLVQVIFHPKKKGFHDFIEALELKYND